MGSHPTRAPSAGGVGKNYIFDQLGSLQLRHLSTKNLYPSTVVVHIHNSSLAEECTVSSTTLVIVKHIWLHFSITFKWHGASHACSVIDEPIATMCVQNYADSWTKRDSCWKCCSDWHTICVCYWYNSWQHFRWGLLHLNLRRCLVSETSFPGCCLYDPIFSHFGTMPACDRQRDNNNNNNNNEYIYTAQNK